MGGVLMDVSWDDVANEAQVSPRGLLADALARADEIGNIIVIYHIDGAQYHSSNVDSTAMMIGMLETTKYETLREMYEGAEA